jgi:hypothetical protein
MNDYVKKCHDFALYSQLHHFNYKTASKWSHQTLFVDLRSQQYLWFNVYYFHYMFQPRSVAIYKKCLTDTRATGCITQKLKKWSHVCYSSYMNCFFKLR